MQLLNLSALTFNHKQLMARFWQSALLVWRDHKGWVVILGSFLLTILLLQLLVQLLLNLWNRNFFDALERRDAAALWFQAKLFVPLAVFSVALAATSVWGRMRAQRGWREALTRQVVGTWLENDRFRHLNGMVKGTENPEYRIAVDVRIATDAPIDLSLAFISSILTALTFFGVLWTVGGSLDVPLFGMTVTIPGYLVLGVVVYASIMSTLMAFVGHHLTGVIERMNQSEAEFRAAADAFRGEKIVDDTKPIDGEMRSALWLRLQAVLLWWREFSWQLVRTTLISHSNFLLAPVVAWLLSAPKYLSGAMTLGELTQSAAAFVMVQSAFNWLVDNYQRVADWRSSVHRVGSLLIALDELEAKESTKPAPGRS
jgi:ABC-type uncharacterized transport system fused permease/ATPase subunit